MYAFCASVQAATSGVTWPIRSGIGVVAFEPAVGIDDLPAVQRLADRLDPRRTGGFGTSGESLEAALPPARAIPATNRGMAIIRASGLGDFRREAG